MEKRSRDHHQRRGVRILALTLTLIGLMTLGMVKVVEAAKPPQVSSASWTSKKTLLKVSGKYWGKKQSVIISNALTGHVLGTVRSGSSQSWSLTVRNPLPVPCRIRAESGEKFAERDVSHAPSACTQSPYVNVFPFNNLGMHCYDSDFSVFSILPPFNVVNAQVVRRGTGGSKPEILDSTQVSLFYSAATDGNGSINTTSRNKTNFWDYVKQLFGADLPVDQGLLGEKMPGSGNVPQPFLDYDSGYKWFSASGIPITAWDDQSQKNSYPLMRIQPFDMTTLTMPSPTFVVVPASDEMQCSDCHGAGGKAADNATKAQYRIASWSSSTAPDIQYRENVLILHDAKHAGNLMGSKPVLCASCHYSPALDLSGSGPQGNQVGKPMLSSAIHGRHGKTLAREIPTTGNPAVIPDTGISTCYYCHPGNVTQCLRGAMGNAGIICQQCHGGLLSVGGVYGTRTPWANEPKCQSCHTGDVLDHLGTSIRQTIAYNPSDFSATPTLAVNKRFAEEDNTLYRNSLGHGGMACEACHGSPHAEWPVPDPNASDNVAAIQLQGHTGPIIECKTCHADGPSLTMSGPHGLHNVNDSNWNQHHEQFYERDPLSCQVCHGTALEGTVLSRAAADRSLLADDNKRISIKKGTQISCTLCHENPAGGD
jgi:hypothetical protein